MAIIAASERLRLSHCRTRWKAARAGARRAEPGEQRVRTDKPLREAPDRPFALENRH
jgi:hypothetical protein